MRELTEIIQPENADHFSNILNGSHIENIIVEEKGKFQIWIINEDQILAARQLLREFNENPQSEKFTKLKSFQKTKPRIEKRFQDDDTDSDQPYSVQKRSFGSLSQLPILTFFLMGICIFIFLLQNVNERTVFFWLAYEWELISRGEIWRLFTPAIMHGNFLHLLFNMYWLYLLGSAIELIKGRRFLILFIGVIAIISNTMQFFHTGPNFLGISGVVYGLFGYVWMKTRFDTPPVFHIDSFTVAIMLIYLVLGIFEVLSANVANSAHIGGLLTGVALGFTSSDYCRSLLGMKRKS